MSGIIVCIIEVTRIIERFSLVVFKFTRCDRLLLHIFNNSTERKRISYLLSPRIRKIEK